MDEDDRVFRLLNVETLEVENYTLRNKPRYLATSHICSQNLFPAVRGETLRSTIGMRMVLKALRSRAELSSVRHCWADAWCINQDPDDKLQQIPLMASIYPDAEMVLITVDHKFSFTQAVWDEVMAKLKPAFQLFWKDIWDGYEHHYIERMSISPEFRHAYNLFLEVACLPWNTRIWTAQEYILAKSAVFIGSNFQQLKLEEHHIKSLLSFQIRFPDAELDRFHGRETAALAGLIDQKLGFDTKSSAIRLAQHRKATIPVDQIYGLMSCSGIIITPTPGAGLAEEWKNWWTKAIQSNRLEWAISPLSTAPMRLVASESWNCIMPTLEDRFCAIEQSLAAYCEPYAPLEIVDGAVVITGRMAGTVVVDICLGGAEILTADLLLLARLVRGDPTLLQILLKTLCDPTTTTENEFTTFVEEACELYRRHEALVCAGYRGGYGVPPPDEIGEGLVAYVPDDKLTVNAGRAFHHHSRVYLGTLTDQYGQTPILITSGQEIPQERLIALDVNAFWDHKDLDRGKGGGGKRHAGAEMAILMVVSVSDRFSALDSGTTLHKVGVTFPVWYHRSQRARQAAGMGACIDRDSRMSRFKIGGKSCLYCARRKLTLRAGINHKSFRVPIESPCLICKEQSARHSEVANGKKELTKSDHGHKRLKHPLQEDTTGRRTRIYQALAILIIAIWIGFILLGSNNTKPGKQPERPKPRRERHSQQMTRNLKQNSRTGAARKTRVPSR